MNSSTNAPAQKVTASTIGAAVAVIVLWIASTHGFDPPGYVQAAITAVITFLFGYITPPAARDVPVTTK